MPCICLLHLTKHQKHQMPSIPEHKMYYMWEKIHSPNPQFGIETWQVMVIKCLLKD